MIKDKIHFVGFDAEFAVKEILELSIYVLDYARGGKEVGEDTGEERHKEIFHQLFRPRNEHRWPGSERVHHISPKMVAHMPFFTRLRPRIQQMIDDADCLVGFAISNDIDALEFEGVTNLDSKPYIDIRDLHWLCYGRDAGIELDARRGLAATAEELGVEFNDSDAHGASYDTRKTMECLERLLDAFIEKYPLEEEKTDLLAHYLQIWDREREAYLKEYAKGWIAIVEAHEGYRLKASRLSEPKGEKVVASVRVMARNRALNEMDAHFSKRRHPENRHIYCLTKSDMKWFMDYANEYDGQEGFHKKMMELRATGLGK